MGGQGVPSVPRNVSISGSHDATQRHQGNRELTEQNGRPVNENQQDNAGSRETRAWEGGRHGSYRCFPNARLCDPLYSAITLNPLKWTQFSAVLVEFKALPNPGSRDASHNSL